jgi:hypothetical protein
MYIIKIELTNGTINSVNEDFQLSDMKYAYAYSNYTLARKAVQALKQRFTANIVILEKN